MKSLLLIVLLVTSTICSFTYVTEYELNDIYEACFDYNNYPIEQDEDFESNYDIYDCNSSCEQDLEEFIQKVKDVNQNQPVLPCNEWWEFQSSDIYDPDFIDLDNVYKYSQCLSELYYLNFEYDQYMILDCAYMLIEQSLQTIGYSPYNDYIIEAADIEQCEDQCNSDVNCDPDCQSYIEENFNNDLEICQEAEYLLQEQIDMEIVQDNGERTIESGYLYGACLEYNNWETEEFYNFYYDIDWEILYETAVYENDYQIDYSALDNLETESKAVLTLDCLQLCYDYFHFNGGNVIDFFFYDNGHVIYEIYDEEDQEEYLNEYYGIYDDDESYWEDDDLDCNDDDCFDENGQFIGNGGEENDCESEYCFIEFYQCNKRCISKHCPEDTCYDINQGQSFENYIDSICIGFNKLKEQYYQEDIIQNFAIVPPQYYESYGDCIAKMQQFEDNNQEREESDKQYITNFYTCLTYCTEEEVVVQENEGKSDQSRLILTLSYLIISVLLLI